MPELKHEIPSLEELDAYLREHLPHSMFAPFGLPPEQLSRTLSVDVAQAFVSINRLDGQAFAQRAFKAILTGLQRLNHLPRDHPFWRNTNRRPTIYKLAEFCNMSLAEDPRDPEALWAAAILPVWFGRNDFGQESWLELSRLPEFDLRWPIYAALTIDLTANSTTEQVAEFLQKANATRESTPILQRIADESEGQSQAWANQVLQLTTEPESN